MTAPFLVYVIALAVAGLILFGAFRYFWRRPAGDGTEFGPPPPEVTVIGRTRIGIGRSLFIVEVEGRRLLLGSTTHSWTALADLGAARMRDEENVSLDSIDVELTRAVEASRQRRGGRRS